MEYTEEFETFWKRYPARWNQDLSIYVKRKKHPAFQKWQKLPKEIQAKCLRIVHLIKKAEGTPRDAVTWLNQQGWDDIDEPELEASSLPQELIPHFKGVDIQVNTNNRRNRQMDELRRN
jgi:hypothetical protein